MGVAHLLVALIGCADPLPPDVLADVSGRPIPAGRYFDALAALREPITERHRRAIVEELVDEALLLERAAQRGVPPERLLHVDVAPPTEEQLRAWFSQHHDAFAQDATWRVQAWRDGEPHPVPDGLLPFGALEQVIGPTAARIAAGLEPGQTGPPSRYASGTLVVRLVERQPGQVPTFDEVRDAVRIAYVHDAERRARVALVEGLRGDAVIRINDAVRDAPVSRR